ncbi:MAG: cupin domain-containing protein [Thermoleophilia bacterium]|nr:cupin domain-containing protein [Thermoleophilia bacterium]
MAHRVTRPDDTAWRLSNQMRTENANVGAQLGATTLGARFWRLHPGETSTRHRHIDEHELYLVVEGTGRMRVDDEVLTLPPHSVVLVDPGSVRQVFNDTDADQLWFIVGAPPEAPPLSTLSPPDVLARVYPDGPAARPPELGG